MKTCTKCGNSRENSFFNKDKRKKSGLRPICKICNNADHLKNKKERNAKGREYYYKNRDERIAYSKKYYSDPQNDAKKTDSRLKRTYGLSLKEYESMLELQNNKCKICRTDQSKLKKKMYVDHNHKTKTVRGLLCDRCNRGLGYFLDSIVLLRNAIEYLDKENE